MSKTKINKIHLERVPVVAVMGHVDHGKTSLLDTIRDTNVQAGEAGGITQNTRAHEVEYNGQKITFIDTPGHEAFSGMRSRGADVTDIVLLVVAADDGVKPQTKESIKYAKDLKLPIIVVANKTDLPTANIEKLKNELSQNDVLVEGYGGDVQFFAVSATKKKGIKELLEGILLQAEILELKKGKSENGKAKAVVLESRSDKNLGAIALVLVKAGEISVGDFLSDEKSVSKVRAILNEKQENIEIGTESMPLWVVGLNNEASTGEILYFYNNESEAKDGIKVVLEEMVVKAEATEEVDDLTALAALFASEQKNDDVKKIKVVIKADSRGTLEVVENEIKKLKTEEVEVQILESGTGEITRKDILTAKNAGGIVLGFQVTIPSDLNRIIQQERVLVRIYSVIYELIDELHDALEGMLEPDEIEEEVARALVKQVFVLTNGSIIAGCVVQSGNIIKGYKVFVERDGEEIGRGKISSLKKLKNEVKEATKGSECGIMVEPQVEIAEGDFVVLYKVVRD